jgi:hypothetical protein
MNNPIMKIFYRATILLFIFGMCLGAGVLVLVYCIEEGDALLAPVLLIVIGLFNSVTWFAYYRHELQVLNRPAA